MKEENIRVNSGRAWLLAARPKTLTGAAVPVIIATGMAFQDTCMHGLSFWLPAILCFLFAFCMQIDANFINDYYDFLKGGDGEDRLGPKRACAQGWITLPAMKRGIVVTTILSGLAGLPLIIYGGIDMIFIGLSCIVFCFLYTISFSRRGLGDILVLVFFGIVPVCTTYYILSKQCTIYVVLLAAACGIVIDTLLVLNNYRDREQDRRHGKITLLVRLSVKGGQLLYLYLGLAGALMALLTLLFLQFYSGLLLIIYMGVHIKTWLHMKKIGYGHQLNTILGETARNIFVFGLLTALPLFFL